MENTYVRKMGSCQSKEVAAGTGTAMQILISSDEAPHFAMRKFVMSPNGGMPRHTNLVEHEQYVVKGSATVIIGDQSVHVSVGDAVFIPSMVPHSYLAGDEGFEFICLVPNKEDKIQILE